MSDSKEQIEVIDVRNQRMKYTIEEMVERENIKRGFTVTVFDKEVLLERIRWKDWSAYFLGKTFVSMYRSGTSAVLNFTDVCNLDSSAKNLLFKIIFARDVERWSDQFLYEVEQEIIDILGLETDENGLIKPTKSK